LTAQDDRIARDLLALQDQVTKDSKFAAESTMGPQGPTGPAGPIGRATANAQVLVSNAPAIALSTALANVNTLSWTVAPGDIWTFYSVLWSNFGTGGLKVAITVPAGTTVKGTAVHTSPDGLVFQALDASTHVATFTADKKLVPADGKVQVDALITIGMTAGSITLQFAQAAQTLVPTKIDAGSFIRALKV
jgi:hypothetical protein